jgi:hypothetical protein
MAHAQCAGNIKKNRLQIYENLLTVVSSTYGISTSLYYNSSEWLLLFVPGNKKAHPQHRGCAREILSKNISGFCDAIGTTAHDAPLAYITRLFSTFF